MKCLLQIYGGRKEFYQWDYNQKLLILDDSINQVHFAYTNMKAATVVDVVTNEQGERICYVPDALLQVAKTLVVYAYLDHQKQGETFYKMQFAIRPREMPAEYVYHQDEELDKIKQRLTILEEQIKELQNK